ncbi:uncharacterized protein THITE_2122237 [Thermothielavioides terrestris NRRL 8126]|uniref:Uncharacterized protein n=1 Tax=Thermothielavioides terrestris (strain ATCC 38088 / NRRL 8126) TaxID=578455 RepID=G2RCH4_THETT|nr:uncharacterized protein THITE_2122237 [Thermothielavioides terrestris NRRL 8126]AEO70609.1 hypothetical protein THITE_2122237 [Thermothielavioides terrestris NRRL 8126]
MVKYSCHIVLFGQIRKEGWRDDHMRFRKVLKEDELCPTCEKRLEREMCRTLHWLQPRVDFTTEVVHLYRNNTVKRVIDAACKQGKECKRKNAELSALRKKGRSA